MEPILEAIVHSPKMNIFLDELTKIAEEEKNAREHFYEVLTEYNKTEFINGEIIMHSPVKIEHNYSGKLLLKLLDTYSSMNNLGYVGYEKLLITLTRNDYEPDICFFGNEKSKIFHKGQTKFPPPDLVVEILSPATEKNDRGIKFEDYTAHEVSEYWIIDPENEIVEQYLLKEGQYKLILKSGSGFIKSQAVVGFEIPIRAIFDEKENLKTLQNMLLSKIK